MAIVDVDLTGNGKAIAIIYGNGTDTRVEQTFELELESKLSGPAEALHAMAEAFLWLMRQDVLAQNIVLSAQAQKFYDEISDEDETGPIPPFALFVLDYVLENMTFGRLNRNQDNNHETE